MIVLGIESTAHTFGIGIVKNGKILSNFSKSFTTEQGGMIPIDVAKHHRENKEKVYFGALKEAGINEKDIDVIAFSQGPGLPPCLSIGKNFAKELCFKLGKPLVPVNHCVAHLEIGGVTGAKDPVMLYASGANTQVIAYASGKYRIFGETLDIGVGNFIDNFARYAGFGFPGGPKIEKIALNGKNLIELPYRIKGMDVAFSGILTNLKQKLESKSPRDDPQRDNPAVPSPRDDSSKDDTAVPSGEPSGEPSPRDDATAPNYSIEDLAYSTQEFVFAMLVESAERALAHVGKKELLLGGGVACNSRLQEMCRIMCKERGAKFFCPEKRLLVDNGAMIAYLGEIMFKSGIKETELENVDIAPRQRTDDVDVKWK